MLNEQVLTVGDPAELVISQEILKLIGVSAGDKIEIAISGRKLIVRSLDEAEQESKMDEEMEALMDRRSVLYERLAEGAK